MMKLIVIIFGFFIFNVNAEFPHCCSNDSIANETHCMNGIATKLTCERSGSIWNPHINVYYLYAITTDSYGKYHLIADIINFEIEEPFFCIGDMQVQVDDMTVELNDIAIVCLSHLTKYKNGRSQIELTPLMLIDKIYAILNIIFSITSTLLLLLTAAIYYMLPNLRAVQDTCYFYLCLTAGLGHLAYSYMEIFGKDRILPNICFARIYGLLYLLLSAMMWSTVNSYHIWRSVINYRTSNANEAVLLKRYKIFAFGVPFCLICFTWIDVLVNHTAGLTSVLDCVKHQEAVDYIYFEIPILISILLNTLMFIHSQIRIWSLHSIRLHDKKSTVKILKYGLLTNAKLFFVMGVPWAVVLIIGTMHVNKRFRDYNSLLMGVIFVYSAALLVVAEGIPIFLILVVFRKRVRQGIVSSKWFADTKIFPDKWKTTTVNSESEEVVSDDETPSVPSTTAQAKYTVSTADSYINQDESVIVNL